MNKWSPTKHFNRKLAEQKQALVEELESIDKETWNGSWRKEQRYFYKDKWTKTWRFPK